MPKPIEITTKPIDKPELVLPNASELNMREVKWVLITPDNYQKVFEDLGKDGRPVVLFGLTDKGYENLGLNLSDLRAYIQQQKAIMVAYENYYKASVQALDEAEIERQKQQAEAAAISVEQSKGIDLNPFN